MLSIAQHTKSNRDGDVLETPEGWVQYWRTRDGIYIDDICVYKPGQKAVIRLAGAVEKIAKEEGKKYLYTNLHPQIAGTERMHMIVYKFGFRPIIMHDIINVYRKEIK
jgi:hypothetical protein